MKLRPILSSGLVVWLCGSLPLLPQTLNNDRVFGRYRPQDLPPAQFADSPRLDALVRAGNLYLSLPDAIALAIENNLDVELQRLTPLFAEADLQRARAGGVARGVPLAIQQGPNGLGGAGPSQSPSSNITAAGGAQTSTDQSLASGNALNAAGNTGVGSSGPAIPSLDPAIVGTFGWERAKSPQTNTFITGTNALTSTSTTGDLRLQQGFLLGGTASIGMDSTRQNTNNARSDVNPNTASGLAVNYVQPLLQGFGLAVNNRYIRIAKNNLAVSDLAFQQQAIETVYTVVQLYWDLVSLNGAARVQRESLDLAQRLTNESVEQERAGTVAPIDVVRTRAAVAAARRDLTIAEARVRQQETILKDYVTRGSVGAAGLALLRVVPTDSLATPAQQPTRPLQDLVDDARRRRPELKEGNLQIENSRIALAGSRSALLPTLDLVLSARTSALFGQVNPLPPVSGSTTGTGQAVRQPDPAFIGGLGTGLSQIFSARFPDYGAQVQLNIPILNRAARSDYTRDQLTLRQQAIRFQQLEKQVSVDVVNAQTAVEQARAAFEAAQEARVAQEQLLGAEREKFAAGVSTNVQLIQVQRDLVEAQSSEVLALDDFAKAQAALERATGGLLERYGVSIEEARQGRLKNLPTR